MKNWEASEAKSVKIYGKKVAGSGSGPFEKLDILGEGEYEGWRGENKCTDKASFSLKYESLKKGVRQAKLMHSRPFYIVDFYEKSEERFILLREQDFIQIMEENHEKLA